MRWSYLRGSSGFLLVADGTRRATLDKAIALEQRAREEVGKLPFVFIINKSDLFQDWEVDKSMEVALTAKDWTILHSSAKTGEGVEQAFSLLTQKLLS